MSGPKPYPQELRQRAVRMVAEVRPNYESDWAAITAVAQKLGVGTAETGARMSGGQAEKVNDQVMPFTQGR